MKLSTDKYHKDIISKVKKINLILEILEMSYEGNVGLAEMMQFFKIASSDEVKKFEYFMAQSDLPSAWELVQRVTKIRLHGLENQTI